MTTIATVRLVVSGDLSLDDAAAQFVAFAVPDEVTIRHLLTHTSGLAFDGWVHVAEGEDELAIEDAEVTVLAPAGATRAYSNQGFAVLGRVIEHVVGVSWREHVVDTIVNPLGMAATLLHDPAGFPDGYTFDDGAVVVEDRYTPGYGPAAAGWTTAHDLVTLGAALVDEPGLRLINQPYFEIGDGLTQGLGLLRAASDRGTILFHSGGWPGWSSALGIHASTGDVVAVGANMSVEARSDWSVDLLDG